MRTFFVTKMFLFVNRWINAWKSRHVDKYTYVISVTQTQVYTAWLCNSDVYI